MVQWTFDHFYDVYIIFDFLKNLLQEKSKKKKKEKKTKVMKSYC